MSRPASFMGAADGRLAAGSSVGYCTNVHRGSDASSVQGVLRQAAALRRALCWPAPLTVGLWLSARAARQLARSAHRRQSLAGVLARRGLCVVSLNGFPFGDFHAPVVRHRVYTPDWRDPRRLRYTIDLVRVLADLLPPAQAGTISTLPLGWGLSAPWRRDDFRAAARHLRLLADHLADRYERTGVLARLALEPEPGCVLERSDEVCRFFDAHTPPGRAGERFRRHVGVCHDVCHAAVMFESQAGALGACQQAGVGVWKVQISSALHVEFERRPARSRAAALRRLQAFREARYLHQTVVRRDGHMTRYDDLPAALAAEEAAARAGRGQWRVHFHVPVYLRRIGPLDTTQADILAALRAAPPAHLEVETYTWSVLSRGLRRGGVVRGMARELRWVRRQLGRLSV